jgi:hypothetical protein
LAYNVWQAPDAGRSSPFDKSWDAPRLQRSDGRSEIVRRANAAACSRAWRFIFAGLTHEECKGLATMIQAKQTVRIDGNNISEERETKKGKM